MSENQLPDDPWQGRTEGMRCRTCVSYCAKQGQIGRCRRHAPTQRGFPVVFESDWCGDHRLNESAVPQVQVLDKMPGRIIPNEVD